MDSSCALFLGSLKSVESCTGTTWQDTYVQRWAYLETFDLSNPETLGLMHKIL